MDWTAKFCPKTHSLQLNYSLFIIYRPTHISGNESLKIMTKMLALVSNVLDQDKDSGIS